MFDACVLHQHGLPAGACASDMCLVMPTPKIIHKK
jgi:hypothetical protein